MEHIFVDYEMNANEDLPADYLEPIKKLWADEAVVKAIDMANSPPDNIE